MLPRMLQVTGEEGRGKEQKIKGHVCLPARGEGGILQC